MQSSWKQIGLDVFWDMLGFLWTMFWVYCGVALFWYNSYDSFLGGLVGAALVRIIILERKVKVLTSDSR